MAEALQTVSAVTLPLPLLHVYTPSPMWPPVRLGLLPTAAQTSLAQFVELYELSIDHSERAVLPAKRIANIIEHLT